MNAPTRMLPVDMQLTNEYRFSRKHIDRYIRTEIEASEILMAKVEEGVKLLNEWLAQPHHASKDARISYIRNMDLKELVISLYVGAAYFRTPELFTSVTGQLTKRLQFNVKEDSIKTVAELMAVLCHTDVFDIFKVTKHGSLLLISNIQLSDELNHQIERSQYLPPMVCEPETIRHNRQSGYLTHNDSVILKGYNHHDDDVCLDVINLQNRIPLSLNVEFLKTVEELPPSKIDEIKDPHLNDAEKLELIREKQENWDQFRDQSREVYALMVGQGNRFYLTHKVDKRGRLYSQGYHITSQGASYKKAMLELADHEIVEGVPQ